MLLKMRFLNSHLNFFPENLRAVNDKQSEQSYQDNQVVEPRYEGFWKRDNDRRLLPEVISWWLQSHA